MKNGFKLFLLVCFIFTFVFSLAFAGDGSTCDVAACCLLPAEPGCQSAGGYLVSIDVNCLCILEQNTFNQCYAEPNCW